MGQREELLKNFANQSDKLFSMGVIRTDSFTGEIGEYIAKQHFNLKLPSRVERAIDGVDPYGKKYQVKAKVESKKRSLSVTNLDIYEVDYLCAVYFDINYDPLRIVRIQNDYFPSSNFRINKKFLNTIKYEEFSSEDISISIEVKKELKEELLICCKKVGLLKFSQKIGPPKILDIQYQLKLLKENTS